MSSVRAGEDDDDDGVHGTQEAQHNTKLPSNTSALKSGTLFIVGGALLVVATVVLLTLVLVVTLRATEAPPGILGLRATWLAQTDTRQLSNRVHTPPRTVGSDREVWEAIQQHSSGVVIMFASPYCRTCEWMKPRVEAVASQPGALPLIIRDSDAVGDRLNTAMRLAVDPTLLLFRNGKEEARLESDDVDAAAAMLLPLQA